MSKTRDCCFLPVQALLHCTFDAAAAASADKQHACSEVCPDYSSGLPP